MSEDGVLLVVAAEAREFGGVLRHAGAMKRLAWPLQFARQGMLHGRRAVLVANGPGPELAAEAVRVASERVAVEGLVSVGFCGALNPMLRVADIFVASELVGVGPVRQPDADGRKHIVGTLFSSDRVAVTQQEKAELRRMGADAVEMEAGAVARAAEAKHLPFYCVRVITDTAGETLAIDFNAMRDGAGRFSTAKILAAALKRPFALFPELMKLNERAKTASRALGEFLADCQF